MTTKTKTANATTGLVVERKHLAQALAQVMPATAARGSSLPILSGVRFEKHGERLRLTGTDLELTVSTTIPADVPEGFDVVVQARLLQRLVKEAAGPLTFNLNSDEGDVTVTWGRTVAILNVWPIAEWPKPKPSPSAPGTKVTLTAGDVQMIRRLANFASRDDARPILCGIRFGGDPHGAAATDSYRLAVADLEAKLPKTPFLLPARVARFLPMGLLDNETCVITIEEHSSGQEAILDVGEITIRSVLIDGEFPPYQNLIPKTPPCRATFNLKELHQAVRTAGVIATEATPVRIALDVKAKTASVVGIQQDVGQLSATVDILNIDGDPVNSCAFNAVYLQELLASLSEETVTLELIDSLKPMTVREGAWTMLIMPVRVS